MPPKKRKSNEFTYALIWFIRTNERYVVESYKLPKAGQKKGKVVKIIWEDASTQISQRYEVKILEFSNDKEELENILLDENGNVCDEQTEMFFKPIVEKKRKLQEETKKETTASKIQKLSLAHKIINKKPLFGPFDNKTPLSTSEVNNDEVETNRNVTEHIENAETVKADTNPNIATIHTFLPVKASEDNKKFLKQIYAGLSAAYEYQQNNTNETVESFKRNGENKKAIVSDIGVFFPIEKIVNIEIRALTETGIINWRKIVKLALDEIYGDNITNYSVVGRNQNSRPSIDRDVFNAIFKWILLKSTEVITERDYVIEISNIIKNKRASKIFSNDSTISKLDLIFLKNIISAVEIDDKWNQNSEVRSSLTNASQRNDFLTPGPTKARISEKHNIFFPKSSIAYIEKRTETSKNSNLSNWRCLVKEALIEVYGNNISNYCAKGRSSRLPINPQLFDAIYAWANSRSEHTIEKSEYISHINKIASNKRKVNKKKVANETTFENQNAGISSNEELTYINL